MDRNIAIGLFRDKFKDWNLSDEQRLVLCDMAKEFDLTIADVTDGNEVEKEFNKEL